MYHINNLAAVMSPTFSSCSDVLNDERHYMQRRLALISTHNIACALLKYRNWFLMVNNTESRQLKCHGGPRYCSQQRISDTPANCNCNTAHKLYRKHSRSTMDNQCWQRPRQSCKTLIINGSVANIQLLQRCQFRKACKS